MIIQLVATDLIQNQRNDLQVDLYFQKICNFYSSNGDFTRTMMTMTIDHWSLRVPLLQTKPWFLLGKLQISYQSVRVWTGTDKNSGSSPKSHGDPRNHRFLAPTMSYVDGWAPSMFRSTQIPSRKLFLIYVIQCSSHSLVAI